MDRDLEVMLIIIDGTIFRATPLVNNLVLVMLMLKAKVFNSGQFSQLEHMLEDKSFYGFS